MTFSRFLPVLHIISSSLFGATFTFFLYFSLYLGTGLAFCQGGGGGGDMTQCRASSTSRIAARQFFFCVLFWTPVSDVFLASTNTVWVSGHIMALFYAHHIFTWQPKGGGGGVLTLTPIPPPPPNVSPPMLPYPSRTSSYSSQYWFTGRGSFCWSFGITRFQRIHDFHNEKLLHDHVSARARSPPAPADMGRQRA